ncbi:hypothetical protein D3C76_1525250 [compost metagenome]
MPRAGTISRAGLAIRPRSANGSDAWSTSRTVPSASYTNSSTATLTKAVASPPLRIRLSTVLLPSAR